MRTLFLVIAASFLACQKPAKKPQGSAFYPAAAREPRQSDPEGDGEIDRAPTPPKEATSKATQPPALANVDFAPILFDFDDATLSEQAIDSLNQLVVYLSNHPEIGVIISGHTDERGTAEYNMALGEQRAHVAKDHLTRFGIDPSRIAVVSYGEESPMSYGTGEEVWAKNRRNEFQIVTQAQASR